MVDMLCRAVLVSFILILFISLLYIIGMVIYYSLRLKRKGCTETYSWMQKVEDEIQMRALKEYEAKKREKDDLRKKKTAGDYLAVLLLVISAVVFLYAGYRLYGIYKEYKVGNDEYRALEEKVITENPDGKQQEQEESRNPEPPITVDFDALKAINEDVVGWLYVEALEISYPVVQGKDNNQYLHTTYEGTYNFAGSIFVDYENSGDFKDPNTIVYGHNMRNGSMFGTLKRIVTENAYGTSPYFWILTPEHNYRYEIFAAYTTAVGSSTYTLFKKHGREFKGYLLEMKSNSEIDTGELQPEKTDNIVTLSTCTGNSSTRFTVQGVQMK